METYYVLSARKEIEIVGKAKKIRVHNDTMSGFETKEKAKEYAKRMCKAWELVEIFSMEENQPWPKPKLIERLQAKGDFKELEIGKE